MKRDRWGASDACSCMLHEMSSDCQIKTISGEKPDSFGIHMYALNEAEQTLKRQKWLDTVFSDSDIVKGKETDI